MGKEVQHLAVVNNRASINDPTLTIEDRLNSMEQEVSLILERIKNLQQPEYTKTWTKDYLLKLESDVGGLELGIYHLKEMLSDE